MKTNDVRAVPRDPAREDPVDELADWVRSQSATLRGAAQPRPIEECLPALAPRLYRIFDKALDEASAGASSGQPVRPEILWAPGRTMVRLGGDSYETEVGETLESLEEALVSTAYALVEGAREY